MTKHGLQKIQQGLVRIQNGPLRGRGEGGWTSPLWPLGKKTIPLFSTHVQYRSRLQLQIWACVVPLPLCMIENTFRNNRFYILPIGHIYLLIFVFCFFCLFRSPLHMCAIPPQVCIPPTILHLLCVPEEFLSMYLSFLTADIVFIFFVCFFLRICLSNNVSF